MALNVRVTEGRPFSKTLHLQGKLDNESVGILDAELNRVVSADVSVIVFDLADLDYISSSGLRAIFRTRKTMHERSGKVLLINPKPQVQKVFEIVNATDLSAVFTSVEELDQYLDAMQRKVIDGR